MYYPPEEIRPKPRIIIQYHESWGLEGSWQTDWGSSVSDAAAVLVHHGGGSTVHWNVAQAFVCIGHKYWKCWNFCPTFIKITLHIVPAHVNNGARPGKLSSPFYFISPKNKSLSYCSRCRISYWAPVLAWSAGLIAYAVAYSKGRN